MHFTQQPIVKQRAWGFSSLLHESSMLSRKKECDKLWRPTYLDQHPFSLSMPSGGVDYPRRIMFVGYPGYTDSTKAAAGLLAEALSNEGQLVTYLRIIYGEMDKAGSGRHEVYFEIGTPTLVLIVSGCTDCSGEGKNGAMYMQRIFACLSHLFDIAEVLEHRAPYPQSEQVYKALKQAVDH